MILSFTQLFSQAFIDSDFSNFLDNKFKQQTFYINQFIDRFNFAEAIVVNKKPMLNRKNNLILLINRNDTSLTQNPLLIEFINDISTDSSKNFLNKLDNNWFAVATGNFVYKNKPLKVDMKLILVGNSKEGYKWLIDSVQSILFKEPIKDYSLYINPLNNEINFSDLSNGLENAKDVWSYTYNIKYNPLISFYDYVRNGDLTFKHISKLRYYFFNIAGYNFTVDYFMRTDMNAGWLISSISKTKL